jgi:hypothetical protein
MQRQGKSLEPRSYLRMHRRLKRFRCHASSLQPASPFNWTCNAHATIHETRRRWSLTSTRFLFASNENLSFRFPQNSNRPHCSFLGLHTQHCSGDCTLRFRSSLTSDVDMQSAEPHAHLARHSPLFSFHSMPTCGQVMDRSIDWKEWLHTHAVAKFPWRLMVTWSQKPTGQNPLTQFPLFLSCPPPIFRDNLDLSSVV